MVDLMSLDPRIAAASVAQVFHVPRLQGSSATPTLGKACRRASLDFRQAHARQPRSSCTQRSEGILVPIGRFQGCCPHSCGIARPDGLADGRCEAELPVGWGTALVSFCFCIDGYGTAVLLEARCPPAGLILGSHRRVPATCWRGQWSSTLRTTSFTV